MSIEKFIHVINCHLLTKYAPKYDFMYTHLCSAISGYSDIWVFCDVWKIAIPHFFLMLDVHLYIYLHNLKGIQLLFTLHCLPLGSYWITHIIMSSDKSNNCINVWIWTKLFMFMHWSSGVGPWDERVWSLN